MEPNKSSQLKAWYESLRNQYRPDQIEVLFIAESPPDFGEGKPRYFFDASEESLRHDDLYTGVSQALFPDCLRRSPDEKEIVLRHLQCAGFWLIDTVELPISKSMKKRNKKKDYGDALKAAVPDLIQRAVACNPRRGVIVCHAEVYKKAQEALGKAGLPILHEERLPFPSRRWPRHVKRFVQGVRKALEGYKF